MGGWVGGVCVGVWGMYECVNRVHVSVWSSINCHIYLQVEC